MDQSAGDQPTEPATHDVVLTGGIEAGHERADVVASLAGLFKKPEADIVRVLDSAPVVVKRGVDDAGAKQYSAALVRAGASVEIRASAQPAAPAPAAPPAAPQPLAAPVPSAPAAARSVATAGAAVATAAAGAAAGAAGHADEAPAYDAEDFDEDDDPPDITVCSAGRSIEWIKAGFRIFFSRPLVWIGMLIVWVLIMVVLAVIPLLGFIAQYLLEPIFLGGAMLACRAHRAGDPIRFNHLFAAFSGYGPRLAGIGGMFLAATMVVGLASLLVIMLLGGGLAALTGLGAAMEGGGMTAEDMPAGGAVVGAGVLFGGLIFMALIIVVTMAFWFAPALVVLRNRPVFDAIMLSLRASLANWLPFLVYGLVLSVLMMIAVIPLGLGLLVVGPAIVGSIYAAYEDIFDDA